MASRAEQSRPESEIKVEGGYERTITRSVAFFGGLVAVSLVESHGYGGGQAAWQVLVGRTTLYLLDSK